MNLNDAYCKVPFVRPTFNKQNMRNDKLVSQNNQKKAMKIIIIPLKDALSPRQMVAGLHCTRTVKNKRETNTSISHLKLVMTALIVHSFFMKIKFAS